ncbi:MAG TPA: hypothetical protein VHX88_01635 [Solirubrobacteraceae bacterium]|jgi:hypothetical protein|nr:hypothetical protein [Solirubrobacteraceae bacterium]
MPAELSWRRARAVLVLLAASFPLALSGCGSGHHGSSGSTSSASAHVLVTSHIAVAIERAIISQRQFNAVVSCPPAVREHAGVTFGCMAQFRGGTTPFVVTQTDNSGHVTYVGCSGELSACGIHATSRTRVNIAGLQDSIASSIERQRNLRARVSCPQGVPAVPTLQFVCLAVAAGATTPFSITVVGSNGGVSYIGT